MNKIEKVEVTDCEHREDSMDLLEKLQTRLDIYERIMPGLKLYMSLEEISYGDDETEVPFDDMEVDPEWARLNDSRKRQILDQEMDSYWAEKKDENFAVVEKLIDLSHFMNVKIKDGCFADLRLEYSDLSNREMFSIITRSGKIPYWFWLKYKTANDIAKWGSLVDVTMTK